MKHAAPILALSLSLAFAPLPAAAQEPPAPEVGDEGPSLMERGLSLFFEGFTQEMEPALDEMAKALEQLGPTIAPALESLMAMVDDMTNYEMPEMLENGDILIRRKADAPPVEPPAEAPATPGVDL
ncbi:AAA+ family ATPase [Rhodobacter sp. HX-7-19]|uniref:AAA+ family ATPase n=1 Tax=Paragemmobacter kunshanensis TaxID=2583234 RepID=A0A6M1TSR4_9RHOB|nr:AAA+ family ATPase [Rhodobacter kunshanensis]NGQ91050.1 AAA+ family ATPase [Rhodobacter kunshanensis]